LSASLELLHIVDGLDRTAIDGGDDLVRLQPDVVGKRAGIDLGDQRAALLLEAVVIAPCRGQVLYVQAELHLGGVAIIARPGLAELAEAGIVGPDLGGARRWSA